MKSFNSVYKIERKNSLDEHRMAVDNDHARLLAAIKKEYGVHNFSTLNESARAKFKRIINEMWDRSNGLNEKGRTFVNEALKPLTEASDAATVDNYIVRELKPNAEAILRGIVNGEPLKFLSEIKEKVESDTKKKIAKKHFVELIGKVLIPLVGKKVNAIKF